MPLINTTFPVRGEPHHGARAGKRFGAGACATATMLSERATPPEYETWAKAVAVSASVSPEIAMIERVFMGIPVTVVAWKLAVTR
jgi:hypothetical protein